jgi:hypothetical protein
MFFGDDFSLFRVGHIVFSFFDNLASRLVLRLVVDFNHTEWLGPMFPNVLLVGNRGSRSIGYNNVLADQGCSLAQYFPYEGEQSNMAGTFDCICQLALMFGTGSGLSASPDFAVFMHEAAQQVGIFVIDFQAFIGAKLAGARPVKALSALVGSRTPSGATFIV